jgi:hypothetical protein
MARSATVPTTIPTMAGVFNLTVLPEEDPLVASETAAAAVAVVAAEEDAEEAIV